MQSPKIRGWKRGRHRNSSRRLYFPPVNGIYRAREVLDGAFPRARYLPCVQHLPRPDARTGGRWPPRLFLAKREAGPDPSEALVNPTTGQPTAKRIDLNQHEVDWRTFAEELHRQGLVVGIDVYWTARIFRDPNVPKPSALDAVVERDLGTGLDDDEPE